MYRQHFVRVGAMGHVGRFSSVDAVSYPRGSRVVLRTSRGLELGEVLSPATDEAIRGGADGSILRPMTAQDDLLETRLERNKQAAFRACERRLDELGIAATLVDVEHLFDGRRLYFYFLGETPPELEALAAELAEVYDAQSQVRRFAETLTSGCGPSCGTEEGGGCGSSCSSCAVAGACGSR